MSQHDFNIANQTFPSFRADLNDALVAAATMSAGSSAPTTPYAYQLWFDTTTGTWKVRNSGNTAWISTITTDLATGNVGIGTTNPSYNLVVSAGGASGIEFGPAYSGTANLIQHYSRSGGVYVDAVNVAAQHRFNTNGTERLRIDSTGSVGIGTASPTSKLSVVSGTNAGITVNDGTVNTILFNTSSANGSLGTTTNHPMAFYANNAERMRIDTSGSVGIGTAPSGGVQLDVRGTGVLQLVNTDTIQLLASNGGSTLKNVSNSPLIFGTHNTERLRIDNNGNVLVGTTVTPITSANSGTVISSVGYTESKRDTTADASHLLFYNPNGLVGYIYTSGTSTSYYSVSDYRLKENVTADWDATTRLKQLNPVRFNFIADADTTVDGFLAHEVQDVVPEAISSTKDGMRDEEYQVSAATGDIYTPAVAATYDEDGVELTAAVDEVIHSADVERPEELAEGQQWRETTAAVMGTRSVPDYQGIDQSKLVPLLVKTIQELEARITALEAS